MAINSIATVLWTSVASLGGTAKAAIANVAASVVSAVLSWVLHTGQSVAANQVAFYDEANACIWQFKIGNKTLYKIDPATDTIMASAVLHADAYSLTDMSADYLYFCCGEVYKFRVHKGTLAMSSKIYIDWYASNQVELGAYVWTGCLGGTGTIKRVDYANNTTTAVTGTGTGNAMGVYDGQYLWFGTNYRSYRTIYKINPATNAVVASFSVSYSLSVGFYHNGYVYFFGSWSSAANGSWPYNGCVKINTSTHAVSYIPAPTAPYDTIGRDALSGSGMLKDAAGNAYYQMLTSSTGKSGIVQFNPTTETWTMIKETTPGTSAEQLAPMYPPDQYMTRYDLGSTRPAGYYKRQ